MRKEKDMDSKISRHLKKLKDDKDYKYNYIIAEIGINHNGDYQTAVDLIQAAFHAGVDAVKFQKRDLNKIYTKKILDDANSAEWNFEYLIPILKEVELTDEEFFKLKEVTKKLGMDFIVTPFDINSAKFCKDLGVDAFKIGSMDMVNYDLLLECSGGDKPMIISTGMWSDDEIFRAIAKIKKLDVDFFMLLANSTYPTPYESINLGYLPKLKAMHRFVGYSGHERGGFIPIAAAALGARVIEKHITFDRNQTGPDHKASMLPDEFKQMVTDLRNLELASGSEKVVNQAEKLAKQTFAVSAHVKKSLKVGHILTKDDIEFKSPGKGIFRHQINDFIGKKLNTKIKKGECLTKYYFEKIVPFSEWNIPKFSKDWGVKCRFHDFEDYKKIKSPVIEFHMSQEDLDIDFKGKSKKSQLIVHAPEIFDRTLVDICSKNKDVVKGSIDILQKAIDKTIEISRKGFPKARPKFVVHLGGMSLDDVLDPTDEMMGRAIDNFKKLKFNPDDIEILPETLPPRPWYFGGQYFQYGFMESYDMIMFCKHFGLNMTLDVCHSALYCNHSGENLLKYIDDVLPLVSHVHLSDATGIDGEGVQIGEGELNFDNITRTLSRKEDFTWVTEIWSGHLNKGAGCRHSMHSLGKYKNLL